MIALAQRCLSLSQLRESPLGDAHITATQETISISNDQWTSSIVEQECISVTCKVSISDTESISQINAT